MPSPLVVHVSSSGSAAGDGSERRPFSSLVAARDALRRVRRKLKPTRPVEVRVAPGVYRLEEPLVFAPEDGGTARCPVTWTGLGGRPMISGGRAITGWSSATINGVPCWQTHLPEAQAGRWWFSQLFVNGRRRLPARWPKLGFLHFAGVPAEEAQRDVGNWFHGAMSAHYVPGDLRPFHNPDDIMAVIPDHWYANHLRIASLDEAKHIIHFATVGSSRLSRDETGRYARYRLDHVREGCSEPGDWYLDRTTGILSYIPMPGENLNDELIEAPRLERLLDVAGDALDAAKRVRHLRFQFLDFRHAEWEPPRANSCSQQADIQVPAAVRFVGAEDCALYACRVSQVAGWAVEIMRGCERNRVVACALYDLGAGGVKIANQGGLISGSEGDRFRSLIFRGLDHLAMGWGPYREAAGGRLAGRDDCPASATTVSDCSIHHGGLIFHAAIGIWVGDASRNRIVHNHIHDFFYSGISCGWTWGYAPAYACDNRIEANRIHDIGQDMLSDMGAIYTLGRQAGTTISRNVISEVRSYGYGGFGIYPDEGTSWMTIEDNVVSGTTCGGFHLHYGRDNLVRGNLFVGSTLSQLVIHRQELVRGLTFTGNLVQGAGNGKLWHGDGMVSADIDRNVYASDSGQAQRFGKQDWATWRAGGRDAHSILADARLLDATALGVAADQATLRAAGIAPARVAQVLSEAGPRFRAVLPDSIDRIPRERETRRPIVETLLWPWPTEWPHANDFTHPWWNIGKMAVAHKARPRPLSLTVANRGDASVSGSYRLRVTPAGAARLLGASRLTVRLKPGERASLDCTVVATGKHQRFRVDAVAKGAHLPSSAIHYITVPSAVAVARLPSGSGPADVKGPATAVAGSGVPIKADLRLAIAGDRLLLHVETSDAAPARGAEPWAGSCVELFIALRRGGEPVQQVILAPAVDGHADLAQLWKNNALSNSPEIKVVSSIAAGGWTLGAEIPLALLGLAPDKAGFAMELVITATPKGAKAPVKAQLGSDLPPKGDSSCYVEAIIADVKNP